MLLGIGLAMFYAQPGLASVVSGNFRPKQTLNLGIYVAPRVRASSRQIMGPVMALISAVIHERLEFEIVPVFSGKADLIIELIDRETAVRVEQSPGESSFPSSSERGPVRSILMRGHKQDQVVLRVLWEETIWESRAGEIVVRPDAFARIVSLLGRAIMGAVANHFENKDRRQPQKKGAKDINQEAIDLKREVKVYSAGVLFLQRLLDFFSHELSRDMVVEFSKALQLERNQLEAHQEEFLTKFPTPVVYLADFMGCRGAF